MCSHGEVDSVASSRNSDTGHRDTWCHRRHSLHQCRCWWRRCTAHHHPLQQLLHSQSHNSPKSHDLRNFHTIVLLTVKMTNGLYILPGKQYHSRLQLKQNWHWYTQYNDTDTDGLVTLMCWIETVAGAMVPDVTFCCCWLRFSISCRCSGIWLPFKE